MIGGANDGSIHIWQERKSYSKPDLLIRLAHTVGSLVTCVTVSPNGYVQNCTNTRSSLSCLTGYDGTYFPHHCLTLTSFHFIANESKVSGLVYADMIWDQFLPSCFSPFLLSFLSSCLLLHLLITQSMQFFSNYLTLINSTI